MYSTFQSPAYQYSPYVPYYATPIQQQQVQQSVPVVQQNNTTPQLKLDTVSGKTAADVYNVNMGEEVILIDIDNPCIYKKSRGFDNKLECKTYDLILREDKPEELIPQIDIGEYLKKDDIEKIVNSRVKEEVDKRLSEISFTPKTTRKKAGDE